MPKKNKKRIAILGSTGSIGKKALEIISNLADELEVVALAGKQNITLLAEQINKYRPKLVALSDDQKAYQLRQLVPEFIYSKLSIYYGNEGLAEIASHPEVDLVLIATVGAVGLLPTISAIRAKKQIALANKEVLVMAGHLIMAEAKKNNVQILPVDSEHSAIFQCLVAGKHNEIKRIILTASGGPFHFSQTQGNYTADIATYDLGRITVEEALKHPTWKMGKKVTVDSATLMNKGFEVIECMHLFSVDIEQIDVVIHPESIVHSLVEFIDGSVIGQLAIPDMYLPIQFAFTYPDRKPTPLPALDLPKIAKLTFYKPDTERFPCLRLAYHAAKIGGTAPTVIAAADEVAVDAFLTGKISFPQIAVLIKKVLSLYEQQYKKHEEPTINKEQDVSDALEKILKVDCWARNQAENFIAQKEDLV